MTTRLVSTIRAARTALVAVLVTALATVGLGVLSTGTAQAAAADKWSKATYEQKVQYWVNVRRKKAGRPALKLARCADGTADRWAKHLATRNKFYHQDMKVVLRACDARYAGETLGKGAISPKYLVTLWMRSPGHKAILMSRSPRHIGIGSYVNGSGQWVTAANFVRL
jgi:uncharacterized protein YkwD